MPVVSEWCQMVSDFRCSHAKYVQELLGHADISLTLNVYSHVLPDMGDAAAGAMDAALG